MLILERAKFNVISVEPKQIVAMVTALANKQPVITITPCKGLPHAHKQYLLVILTQLMQHLRLRW